MENIELEEIKKIYFSIMEKKVKDDYKNSNDLLLERLKFALGRFEEGEGISSYIKLMEKGKEKIKILDAGCGSGGVMLPLALEKNFEIYGVEKFIHSEIQELKMKTNLPFNFCISDIRNLPFPDKYFDWVLFLDTIEHIKNPEIACKEIHRVLKNDGFCMITTPCRWKYLFKRDPHFGIFFLLLFPNKIQKLLVEKFFKRTKNYDIEKIFFSPFSILRLFPKPRSIYFLYNEPLHKESLFEKAYRKTLRKYFFDKILIKKGKKKKHFQLFKI